MKTLTKTILALSGLLLLAGCGAAAQDPTPQVGPGYGPGAAAIGPDGTVDPAKLPPWCPYSTAPDATKTTK